MRNVIFEKSEQKKKKDLFKLRVLHDVEFFDLPQILFVVSLHPH